MSCFERKHKKRVLLTYDLRSSCWKLSEKYSENVRTELVFQVPLQFNCNQIYDFVQVGLLSVHRDLSKESLSRHGVHERCQQAYITHFHKGVTTYARFATKIKSSFSNSMDELVLISCFYFLLLFIWWIIYIK